MPEGFKIRYIDFSWSFYHTERPYVGNYNLIKNKKTK